MKEKHKIICKKCGKEFEIECTHNEWIKGKHKIYCSRSCANSHKLTDEQKKHISNGIKNSIKFQVAMERIYGPKEIHYICEKCGKEFISENRFKKDRKIVCNDCKRKVKHYNKENEFSILDCSKRTISKILNRSKIGCAICGWNESTCDIHHIIEKSKGGSNDISNLIIVCPNHHRIIHTNKCYSIEYLKKLSIKNTFNNWKDYYHPER